MPKKILLIENDSAFAAQVSEALESGGFDVRIAPEGKAGLDLAREWGPNGIVLSVELPGMSGYLVCQKLRKDEATRAIPLILSSAEATADTFEKHKALKVRADEYLLKPYAPGDLFDRLAALGLPAEVEPVPPDTTGSEELVSLEEASLEAISPEVPSLDLTAMPDEPAEPSERAPVSLDDDLSLLDEAFEGIAAPSGARERPVEDAELSAAADSLPEEDETTGRMALSGLELDENALSALEDSASSAVEDAPPLDLDPGPVHPAPAVRGASADFLRAAGIPVLDAPAAAPAPAIRATPTLAPPRPGAAPIAARTTLHTPAAAVFPTRPEPAAARPEPFATRPEPTGAGNAAVERIERELAEARAALAARETEAKGLRGRAEEAARRAESAEGVAADREADLASVKAKLDAVTTQARRADQELKATREERRRAADELDGLRAQLAEVEHRAEAAEGDAARRGQEAQSAVERLDAVERELDSLRTDLVVARGEAEGAREEVEARTADLRKRIAELEANSAKNEERVLKAYQKIKGDEKVKDKVRKAIAIAAQLLEEGLPAEGPSPIEKLGGESRS
jgi:CheY-like chemotaxis protein